MGSFTFTYKELKLTGEARSAFKGKDGFTFTFKEFKKTLQKTVWRKDKKAF